MSDKLEIFGVDEESVDWDPDLLVKSVEENRKLLNALRKNEPYFIRRFKEIQSIKRMYVERNPEVFMDALSNGSWEKFVYFKKMSMRDKGVKNLKEITANAVFITKKMYELTKDPSLLSLAKEESVFLSYIVMMHFPAVISVIRKKTYQMKSMNRYFYELFHEGVFGIIHALHNFDDRYFNKFVTYAYYWIGFFVQGKINQIVKENNSRNGTEKRYAFKTAPYGDPANYVNFVRDLHNSKVDFINLFPDYNLVHPEKMRSEWNRLMESSSDRRKLLREASKYEEASEALNKPYEPKLVARLVIESFVPSAVKCGMDRVTPIPDYETLAPTFGRTHDEELEIDEARRYIYSICKKAGVCDDDLEEIERFLREETTNVPKRIVDVLKKAAGGGDGYIPTIH